MYTIYFDQIYPTVLYLPPPDPSTTSLPAPLQLHVISLPLSPVHTAKILTDVEPSSGEWSHLLGATTLQKTDSHLQEGTNWSGVHYWLGLLQPTMAAMSHECDCPV